ncbi:MAG: Lrp/AsnC ligand binding domain-containing protein [Marmoricola sp.]|nr:Lrp/AsnC ligand binding domain-containing protein [Marmoricola sp.]
MLQVDGRQSYAAIARALNTDEHAVEHRVTALVESGVVTFTTVADPLRLGFARQAMLGISVEQGHDDGVARRLAEIPETAYVLQTGGDFDVLAEVVARSDAHLEEIVSTLVVPIPGVRAVRTFPYEAVEKQTYSWSVL